MDWKTIIFSWHKTESSCEQKSKEIAWNPTRDSNQDDLGLDRPISCYAVTVQLWLTLQPSWCLENNFRSKCFLFSAITRPSLSARLSSGCLAQHTTDQGRNISVKIAGSATGNVETARTLLNHLYLETGSMSGFWDEAPCCSTRTGDEFDRLLAGETLKIKREKH